MNMGQNITLSSGGYPKLKKIVQNSYYEGILQNLYAGSEGEVVSYLQLSYQTFVIKDAHADIAKAFKLILSHDAIHVELLAKALVNIGGNPIFYNNQKKFLSAKQIDYVQNIESMILSNIELKEQTVIDYKMAISKISNINLKIFLERILKDEELHLKILRDIKNNLKF